MYLYLVIRKDSQPASTPSFIIFISLSFDSYKMKHQVKCPYKASSSFSHIHFGFLSGVKKNSYHFFSYQIYYIFPSWIFTHFSWILHRCSFVTYMTKSFILGVSFSNWRFSLLWFQYSFMQWFLIFFGILFFYLVSQNGFYSWSFDCKVHDCYISTCQHSILSLTSFVFFPHRLKFVEFHFCPPQLDIEK